MRAGCAPQSGRRMRVGRWRSPAPLPPPARRRAAPLAACAVGDGDPAHAQYGPGAGERGLSLSVPPRPPPPRHPPSSHPPPRPSPLPACVGPERAGLPGARAPSGLIRRNGEGGGGEPHRYRDERRQPAGPEASMTGEAPALLPHHHPASCNGLACPLLGAAWNAPPAPLHQGCAAPPPAPPQRRAMDPSVS